MFNLLLRAAAPARTVITAVHIRHGHEAGRCILKILARKHTKSTLTVTWYSIVIVNYDRSTRASMLAHTKASAP